jgi:soluble lytic murein transglycosylase-like protein
LFSRIEGASLAFDIARQAVLLAAVAACCLAAEPVAAQVLEIGADGAVTRFDGPTVFTRDGATVLASTAEPPSSGTADVDTVRLQLSTAADAYALDPKLIEAVAWRESRFRADARSSKGAVGVMQLMPGTARDLGVDPFDVTQNIRGGALYLSRMLSEFGGDVRLALAAYNAGPAAVRKHGGVPPYAETQAYVTSILGRMAGSSTFAVPALGASR